MPPVSIIIHFAWHLCTFGDCEIQVVDSAAACQMLTLLSTTTPCDDFGSNNVNMWHAVVQAATSMARFSRQSKCQREWIMQLTCGMTVFMEIVIGVIFFSLYLYEEYLLQNPSCGRKGNTTNKRLAWEVAGRGLMFTFIGQFMQVKWPMTMESGELTRRTIDSADEAARLLKKSKAFQDMWRLVVVYVEKAAELVHADCVTVTAEVCPGSLVDPSAEYIQWHAHAMLHSKSGRRLYLPDIKPFHSGVIPYVRACARDARLKECSLWRGHYYVAAAKIGTIQSIWSKSCTPFVAYPVQGFWIASLWMRGKMNSGQAKKDHVKSRNRPRQWIEAMDWVELKEEELMIDSYLEMVEADFEEELQEIRVPDLVRQWERQYSRRKKRYKFLVLEGPSKSGKTVLAKRLEKKYLEVDCANTKTPDLKEFRYFKHKLVFFDEAEPQMVINFKKLFQSGDSKSELGSSGTGCYAYHKLFHGTKLVICSNDWTKKAAKLKTQDQEWLQNNSVKVLIRKGDLYDDVSEEED